MRRKRRGAWRRKEHDALCRKERGTLHSKRCDALTAEKKQNFKETIVRRADVNNFIMMRMADMRMSLCAMCRQDIR